VLAFAFAFFGLVCAFHALFPILIITKYAIASVPVGWKKSTADGYEIGYATPKIQRASLMGIYAQGIVALGFIWVYIG
jgi:hypothetical protein